MVKFPDDFVQLNRYPGYYWNTVERHLYSIKVTGVLTKLAKSKGYHGMTRNGLINIGPGYRISCNGRKRYLSDEMLRRMVIGSPAVQTVPINTVR